MGETLGDRVRNVTGDFGPNAMKSAFIHWAGWHVFSAKGSNSTYAFVNGAVTSQVAPDYLIDFNLSRMVPVGAANIPRTWGALACAYFGQQARI